jgi:O-methyltransferase domain
MNDGTTKDSGTVAFLTVFGRLAEPWAIRVAATLRLADIIGESGENLEEIAKRAEVDSSALGRLLRFLVARGVFSENSLGVFTLNRAARALCEGHPSNLREWFDLDGVGSAIDGSFQGLLDAVRTGEPAFDKHMGKSFWETLASNSQFNKSFASNMERQSSEQAPEIVEGYSWPSLGVVIDVGGGTGSVLSRILETHKNLRGILLDAIASPDETAELLVKANVSDRCEVLTSSFFDELPSKASVYLLRNVIHDWSDRDSVRILQRCFEAMTTTSRVVIVERVLDGKGNQRETTDVDLRMLVLFGSRERSLREFDSLAAAAHLQPLSRRPISAPYWILEYSR